MMATAVYTIIAYGPARMSGVRLESGQDTLTVTLGVALAGDEKNHYLLYQYTLHPFTIMTLDTHLTLGEGDTMWVSSDGYVQAKAFV